MTATWHFKHHFRSNAFGWRGSVLACKRLNEAVAEIKKMAKTDPVLAGEGVVALCERLWPALQHVDSSSGALGSAVYRALDSLLPLLIAAPANLKTRRKWLERMEQAIFDDGVDYLVNVRQMWGKVCADETLMNECADSLLPMIRRMWTEEERHVYAHSAQTLMCLSCLLESERDEELQALLASAPRRNWDEQSYWAEALRRRGDFDAAIAFAEGCRSPQGYDEAEIGAFCEQALLDAGDWKEAYTRYGQHLRAGHTYLNQYRAIVNKYPMLEPRRILQDLIVGSANTGEWFAAARTAGQLDIALECAQNGQVNPGTLTTAAHDTFQSAPEFSFAVALRALDLFLSGYGYDDRWSEMLKAAEALAGAAKALGNPPSCLAQVQSFVPRVWGSQDPLAEPLRQHMERNWSGLHWSN